MKYNVIHIHNYSTWGGNIEHINILLRNLDKDKFNVMFAGPFCCDYMKKFSEMDIKVINSEIKNKYDLKTLFNFVKILKKERIHILHTHIRPADFIYSISARIAKTPIKIATLHNTINITIDGKRDKSISSKIYNFILSYNFDKIITVSNALREDVISTRGILQEKIIHITNGIELQKFNTNVNKFDKKRELGIKSEYKIVGMIARFTANFSYNKGHIFLIKAIPIILQNFSKVIFVFVGEGESKPYFENLVKKMGIQNNVLFLSFRNDIAEIYKILDVCVLPSLFEGMPRCILEAMYCEVPIVASEIPEIKEVIEDNINGFLVKPKDKKALAEKILILLKDDNLRKEIGKRNKIKIEKYYDAKIMVKDTERVYEELINEKIQALSYLKN